MHISEWKPGYEASDAKVYYWHDKSWFSCKGMEIALSLFNVADRVNKRKPEFRQAKTTHGIRCLCKWCIHIKTRQDRRNALKAGTLLPTYYDDNIINQSKLELSIISFDGTENEIECLMDKLEKNQAHDIMFQYELTEWQLVKLLQMQSPYLVPNDVCDDKTFFAAFKRGEVRSTLTKRGWVTNLIGAGLS